MPKSLIATLALAAGILTTGALASSASAAPAVPAVHKAATAVQHVEYRRHFEGREHERFEHRRFHRGPVFYLNSGHGYGNGDGCYWLKRRALNSGSRYWWHRYNECRGW